MHNLLGIEPTTCPDLTKNITLRIHIAGGKSGDIHEAELETMASEQQASAMPTYTLELDTDLLIIDSNCCRQSIACNSRR